MSTEHATTVGAPDSADAPGAERAARSDRVVRGLAVAIVLVVLAVISVSVLRWFRGLDVVTPVGNEVTAVNERPSTAVFGTQIVGYGPLDAPYTYDPQPVDVRSITPVVVQNTADATIELVRCTGGDPVGASDASSALPCEGATPFEPGTMVLGATPPDQIVAVVTARQDGVVVIDGFLVDYAVGIRSTTVQAGIRIQFTVGAQSITGTLGETTS
jgi:hypothetical protein